MKLDKPRRPSVLVTSEIELEQLIRDLASDPGSIAIDAERASGFRYSQRAYLIQIALRDQTIYMVDPVALSEVEDWEMRLKEVLNPRTWLLHAATQDLPCLSDLGFAPQQIIDTELAARLAGFERVGLGSLALELLGIELAKEHSASDWSQRPLTEEMLHYGALDVDVLHELWDAVETVLKDANKLDWALQEFEHLLSFKPKPQLEEPWRNLPGISKVKDLKKLRIAASLWHARDEIAQAEDIAPGRLIPDRSIMAAVDQVPKSKSDLAQNKAFQGRASRSKLGIWWEAIARSEDFEIAAEAPRTGGIPNHRSWEKRFPQAHIRLSVVRPLVQELATELNLPVENLITPDYLRRVMFEPALDIKAQLVSLGVRSWQVDLVLPVIEAGLNQARPLLDALEA